MAELAATYVYAIGRDLDPAPLRGLRGVAGEPVRVVEHAGLRAVVGSVGLEDFGEEPLRRALEDPRRLEALLRAHHRVVQAAAGAGAALPLRLATVYRGDGRVRELLEERRASFEAALSLVAGRAEWGVKVCVDPAALAAGPAPAAAAAGPGTAYLQRRRAEEQSRQVAWDRAMALAERVHAALARVAAASRRHPPQDPRLSGHTGWMVLNGAYLVDDGRQEALARVVAGFHDPDRGVRLELTGPWAPYSFTGDGGA